MIHKIAVLIDGAFFVQRFKALNGRSPVIADIQPFIDSLIAKVQARNSVSKDSLYRIFYYDCRPFGNTVSDLSGNSIDYSKTPLFIKATKFQLDLKTHNQLALRLGELSFDGWKLDSHNPSNPPKPDFKQKSVDMKIGLDIAWMASNRIVDKILLVAGDSDFVSPMKFARKEGLLVYLETMGHARIKLELKEHSDFVL
jgi:uncharacterized LabA/DUF88 family protein